MFSHSSMSYSSTTLPKEQQQILYRISQLERPKQEESELTKALRLISAYEEYISYLSSENKRLREHCRQLETTFVHYQPSYQNVAQCQPKQQLRAISYLERHSDGDRIDGVREILLQTLGSSLLKLNCQLHKREPSQSHVLADYGLLLWRVGQSRVDITELGKLIDDTISQTTKGLIVVFLLFSTSTCRKSEPYVTDFLATRGPQVIGSFDFVYCDSEAFDVQLSQNSSEIAQLTRLLCSI